MPGLSNYQLGGADEEQKSESPLCPEDMSAPSTGQYQMTGADEITEFGRSPVKPPHGAVAHIGQYQMTGADEVELNQGETWPWSEQTSATKPL